MKKSTFLLALLFTVTMAFTHCSKKSNNPTPTNNTPTSNYLVISGGATETFTVSTNGSYTIYGASATGTYTTFSFSFQGKPTAGSYTIGSTQLTGVYLSDGSNLWSASSGTVTVTVSGNGVTATFANVSFNDGGTPITASGSLTSTN